jgi:predicted transcriptional regulator
MTEYELTPKELSLLLGLAALRHKEHSKILLSDTEIYKKTDFSRNTFKKHIGKLIDLGLVKKGDDGYYSVSKDIFPIEKVTIPKELARQMAEWYNIPFEGKDHLKKMFAFYAKDNFVNLRMNPKKFCLSLLGGCSMEQMKKSLYKEAKKRRKKPAEFSF